MACSVGAGWGRVFRARDLTLDRPVAIKVVTGDVATNPDLRARFLQEARTVAKLRHPNIVAVYSAGDADGMLYFAMELVPGESLRDLLDREKRVDGARAERLHPARARARARLRARRTASCTAT
jgi:serine/threonine protein kinase